MTTVYANEEEHLTESESEKIPLLEEEMRRVGRLKTRFDRPDCLEEEWFRTLRRAIGRVDESDLPDDED